MKHITSLVMVAIFVLTNLFTTQPTSAQLFGSKDDKPSSEMVPRTAFMGLTAFPQKIAKNPELRIFPHEVVTAWGLKELGFDPMLIKEVTLVVKAFDKFPPDQEPDWAVIMHFEKMQGLSGNMIDQLEKKTIAGKTVFDGTGSDIPSFMLFDESTLIAGNLNFFEELVIANGSGKLVEMIKSTDVSGELLGFVDLSAVRAGLSEVMADFDDFELPPEVDNLRQIMDLVDSFEFGLETETQIEGKLVMHAANENDAERVKEILVDGMKYGKNALLSAMASEMDMRDPVQAATVAYAKRVYEKYESKYTPEINGSDLTMVANEEILLSPMLMGLIGNFSRNLGFPTRMQSPERQIRITVLASHNYESTYKHFPARSINSEHGTPLLSGRVLILPFMEQTRLYQNLRMDEPWDSEHNSQFTSKVIPLFGITADGRATVRFPVFPGSIWDGDEPAKLSNMLDGMSNTIFSIQVAEKDAISWADPTPWVISESNPMRDVFGDRDEVIVGMADGSTRTLRKSEMTNKKLRAMLTMSGGEVSER